MAGILFLGVANASRTPLAEAIARELAPAHEIWSAGSRPSHVRPEVRAVLSEAGYRAENLRSKSLAEVPLDEVDVVITLADPERCPRVVVGRRRVTWNLPDPASAPREEALEAYRATRDELLRRLPALLREI